jgi:hypothetical protein
LISIACIYFSYKSWRELQKKWLEYEWFFSWSRKNKEGELRVKERDW